MLYYSFGSFSASGGLVVFSEVLTTSVPSSADFINCLST